MFCEIGNNQTYSNYNAYRISILLTSQVEPQLYVILEMIHAVEQLYSQDYTSYNFLCLDCLPCFQEHPVIVKVH